MPIYEYQCHACEHVFELIQKISDAPVTECPQCTKAEVVKLVSAPKFKLKGSGWYETDFKDKPNKSTKNETASETIADSKPKEKAIGTETSKG